jgi:hypothetical protein
MADDQTRADDAPGRGRTVSTPEGDNEFAPDQPLAPSTVESDVDGLQRWPTNSAMEADKKRANRGRHQPDNKDQASPSGVERAIDEVSTGKILP